MYYQDDIRNALRAAEQATRAALPNNSALPETRSPNDAYAEGYWDGYRAALMTIALAFGLVERHEQRG